VTTAQKLLGHSDPMMTLRVYTSVLDSEIDDAGFKLINFINPSGNKISPLAVHTSNAR
jgi:integrase